MPACIESLCNQTLSDLEIILVDDGSTDRSGSICDEYAEKDSRIVVIHKDNGGHTSARNEGLKAARGEYIGFVDSDDWVEPTMYEAMLSVCEQEDADIAVSSYDCGPKGKLVKNRHPIPAGVYKQEDLSKQRLLKNLLCKEDYSSGGITPNLWSKLFKKELLCRHQFQVDPRITYGEDAACVYPCLLDADRIAVIDQVCYHYRIREDSICNSADPRYFERITYLYQQLKTSFLNHQMVEILMEQLDRYMLGLVLDGINKMLGLGLGKVVPTSILPYDLPQRVGLKTIVLYGAGEIGQRYYRWYEKTQTVKITAWVDRDWEKYRAQGLAVQPLSALDEREYDGVLIAVSSPVLADKIMCDLNTRGIPEGKLFYEAPKNLLQTLQR